MKDVVYDGYALVSETGKLQVNERGYLAIFETEKDANQVLARNLFWKPYNTLKVRKVIIAVKED